MPRKTNVLVICGGPSNERDVSLKTGLQIAKSLPNNKYELTLAEISKDGRWFLSRNINQFLQGHKNNSKALIPHNSTKEFKTFEVAFIGMHGRFGEDGKIQAILETIGIPYTGSGVLASALGMNKIKTLEFVSKHKINTPKFLAFDFLKRQSSTFLDEVKENLGFPCVVKPNESGSSIGISIVKKEEDLKKAIQKALNEDHTVLIEEYIKGKEFTCAVMGNAGQTEIIALPPIEIIPDGEFFDYDSKYFSQKIQEICPARITKNQTEVLQELSKKIHSIIGCDGLSRSDFILTNKGKFHFLEINTIPGLTEASLAPKAATAHGMSFTNFLDKQIKLAILKGKQKPTTAHK